MAKMPRRQPAIENADARMERRVDIPQQFRSLDLRAETWNEEARTVDVVWSTGAPVNRMDWWTGERYTETLSLEPGAVRMERLNGGASVLNTHGQWSLEDVIGTVVPGSARIEEGAGVATLKLSAREELAGIVQDIRDGIIRNVSVGYLVHKYQETRQEGRLVTREAIDWEPMEISFVPVPADGGAQSRSNPQVNPCIIIGDADPQPKETAMPQAQPAARSAEPNDPITTTTITSPDPIAAAPPSEQRSTPQSLRAVDIRARCAAAGLNADQTLELMEQRDAWSAETLALELNNRQLAAQGDVATRSRVTVTRDGGDTARRGLTSALELRMGVSVPAIDTDLARQFRSFSLVRLAESLLEIEGVAVRGLAPVEIAERALHSTSDFPNILANVMNKRLRAQYEENQQSYRIWARRAPNAPDFKTMDVSQLANMPDLTLLGEGGEVKSGMLSDGKESYRVLTYARKIGITRQALVNDDLRGLERIVTGFAGSAARLENRTVYAQLTSNAALNDGVALFHATHANLAGAVSIDIAGLTAARLLMRKQKGLQSEELNLTPRYLIVPAALEQVAYQFTSPLYQPATAGTINEFRSGGRTALEPVVESLLDAASATQWYLAADSGQVDTVEYCYLDGSEGAQIASRIGFDVDGMEVKATLDFAAKVIDHRGLVRAN